MNTVADILRNTSRHVGINKGGLIMRMIAKMLFLLC